MQKKFQQDEENKKRMNKNEMEDMQTGYKLHVTGIIYVCKIWKQNKMVISIQKKYQ